MDVKENGRAPSLNKITRIGLFQLFYIKKDDFRQDEIFKYLYLVGKYCHKQILQQATHVFFCCCFFIPTVI